MNVKLANCIVPPISGISEICKVQIIHPQSIGYNYQTIIIYFFFFKSICRVEYAEQPELLFYKYLFKYFNNFLFLLLKKTKGVL